MPGMHRRLRSRSIGPRLLPGAPVFGLKLDSAPIYVAASKNIPAIDLEKWRATFAAMEKDATRARILAAYWL